VNILDLREPFSALSHGSWWLLSLPAVVLLWRRGGGDLGKRVSLVVFGLSLAACFAGSTLYHGVRGSDERIAFFALMDYIGIFLLIAGTYTPIAWNMMSGRWRLTVLAVAWTSAAAGIALQICCTSLPPEWRTGLYLGLGWGALFCYFDIARRLSHRAMRPFLAGGIFYSVGAVLNLLHWPILWPGVFQAHELFHLLVMAGSLSHFWFIFMVVATFDQAAIPPCPAPAPALAEAAPVRARRPARVSRLSRGIS
jgi:hemolysin III